MSPAAIGSLFGLLILGVPIASAIVLASAFAGWQRGLPDMLLVQRLFTGLDSFPIMAVPLFILAGEIMNESGITHRIIRLADAFVGHFRAGLAQVAILSSVIFAGISGSAVADASALGRVFIPNMEKEGYPRDFGAALIAGASVIGPIIPPSIPMVIFALIVQQSVGALFLAGVVPGLLLGAALSITTWVGARSLAPKPKRRSTWPERWVAIRQGLIPIVMPALILVTILSGVVTPTEAAAVAVLYALVVGLFILRTLSLRSLFRVFASSMLTSSVILFIMASANLLSWLLTTEQVPQQFGALIIGHVGSQAMFLLLVNVMLLIVGCLMEGLAAMVILVPIIFPVAMQLGVNPIHFGTIVVLNLMIGLLTPPMGLLLFVVDGIAHVGLPSILRRLMPMLIAELVVLAFVTLVPALSTWLPHAFGY